MERKTGESNTDTADYENEKVDQPLPNDLDAFDEFVRIVNDQPQPEVTLNPTPVSTLNSMPDSYSSPYGYGYRYSNEIEHSPSGHAAAGGSAWNSFSFPSIHSPKPTGFVGTSPTPSLGSEQPYHYQMFNFGESQTMRNLSPVSEPSTPAPRDLVESVRVMSLSNPETTQLLHNKREGARGHVRKGKGKLKMHEMDSDDKRFRNAKVAKANRDEKKREIEELRRENEMLAQANTELEIDWFRRREIIRQLEENLADAKNRNKSE